MEQLFVARGVFDGTAFVASELARAGLRSGPKNL